MIALKPEAIKASAAAPREVTQYLAALLRESLGRGSKAVLCDETVTAWCALGAGASRMWTA